MEDVDHENNKVIWEVVDDHVVEYPTDHEEIVLRGFGSIFSKKMRR